MFHESCSAGILFISYAEVYIKYIISLTHSIFNYLLIFKVFQDYVRASSLKVFSPEFQTGHFRQLMVRSAPDQLMVVVGIHPQDLSEEELTSFKKGLVDFFSRGGGKKANVTSLYYQKIVKK